MDQGGLPVKDKGMLHSPKTDFDSLEIPVNSDVSASPAVSRLADGLSDLPYEHMNFNVDQSLPDLAGELVAAQCSQYAEVDQREETVLKIQTELQQEKDQLKSTERDICSCSKTICLAQSDIAEREEECTQLRKEISFLVSECQDLKLELKNAEEEGEKERQRHKVYGTMMKRHATQVRELERTLPLQKELESLHSHMEELNTHRDGLKVLRGERQQDLRKRIVTVEESVAEQKRDNHHMEEKLENGRERIQQLKRDLEMSKKRHVAQVTRLQRQVAEAQSRRRQWIEETARVKQAIQNLRQKIEE